MNTWAKKGKKEFSVKLGAKLNEFFDYDHLFIGTGEQKRVLPKFEEFLCNKAFPCEEGIDVEERAQKYNHAKKELETTYGFTDLFTKQETHHNQMRECIGEALEKSLEADLLVDLGICNVVFMKQSDDLWLEFEKIVDENTEPQ